MKDYLKKNGIRIGVIVLAVALLIGLGNAARDGQIGVVQNVTGVLVSPMQKVLSSAVNWFDTIYGYLYEYDSLLAENESLRSQLADAQQSARDGIEASEENKRLRQLLYLRDKHTDYVMESAKVVLWSASNWSSSFTISKGRTAGIELNDPVVTEEGILVGQITELGTNWATVSTLIDVDMSVGAFVGATGSSGMVVGEYALMKNKTAKLTFLADGAQIFVGDEVLVMDGIRKGFSGRTLFSDLELLVVGGERIALIGDNGTGKSTLVKLIMQEETPDAGYLYLGPTVRTAYLPQLVGFTNEQRSALDTMLYDCRCSPQQARDRLAAFGFRGEDVMTPVGALSGGEKSRLRLCMLMGGDINFLILDEPTNHLDIASREWMEDALSDYEQTLLFVSHDRYFIEKFATRIWALHDGVITAFRGGYREYCAWRERQTVFAQNEKQREKEQKKETKTKPQRPKNNDKALQKLEREIARQEEKIAEKDREAEAYATDYQKLMEISAEKEELEAALLELYERWEELSE